MKPILIVKGCWPKLLYLVFIEKINYKRETDSNFDRSNICPLGKKRGGNDMPSFSQFISSVFLWLWWSTVIVLVCAPSRIKN